MLSWQVVRRFARHFQTGAPMPEDMLQRLCASKHLFGASEMQLQVYLYPTTEFNYCQFSSITILFLSLQVFYSALDQQYHGPAAARSSDTTDVLRQVQKQYYGLPYVDITVSLQYSWRTIPCAMIYSVLDQHYHISIYSHKNCWSFEPDNIYFFL